MRIAPSPGGYVGKYDRLLLLKLLNIHLPEPMGHRRKIYYRQQPEGDFPGDVHVFSYLPGIRAAIESGKAIAPKRR